MLACHAGRAVNKPLIQALSLGKTYYVKSGLFRPRRKLEAVSGVDFAVDEGTTFGLVGESGSGKSTIARLVLGVERPTTGRVEMMGNEVPVLDDDPAPAFRRLIQPVMQDSTAALDPRMNVGRIIEEPLRIHDVHHNGVERSHRVTELLSQVGLDAAMAKRFSSALSGGQRQRVAIARALALNPRVLVLDEPVSSLDASTQAQILNLLKQLQSELALTCILISHDMAVIAFMSQQIGVLYMGRLVEVGLRDTILKDAQHPYTIALLASADHRAAIGFGTLQGEIPSPFDPPSGCAYHPRCPLAAQRCRVEAPLLRSTSSGRKVACHFAEVSRSDIAQLEHNQTITEDSHGLTQTDLD